METSLYILEQFVQQEQALELKELGFNEKCFGYYGGDKQHLILHPNNPRTNCQYKKFIAAPLYQQAFDWFFKKYKLFVKFDYFHSTELDDVDYDYCIIDMNNPFKENLKEGVLEDNPLIDYKLQETYYLTPLRVQNQAVIKLIELIKNRNNEI